MAVPHDVLYEQKCQENAILQDECAVMKTALKANEREISALREQLALSEANVSAQAADAVAAKAALMEFEKAHELDTRLATDGSAASNAAQVKSLEAQVAAFEETMAKKLEARTACLELGLGAAQR